MVIIYSAHQYALVFGAWDGQATEFHGLASVNKTAELGGTNSREKAGLTPLFNIPSTPWPTYLATLQTLIEQAMTTALSTFLYPATLTAIPAAIWERLQVSPLPSWLVANGLIVGSYPPHLLTDEVPFFLYLSPLPSPFFKKQSVGLPLTATNTTAAQWWQQLPAWPALGRSTADAALTREQRSKDETCLSNGLSSKVLTAWWLEQWSGPDLTEVGRPRSKLPITLLLRIAPRITL